MSGSPGVNGPSGVNGSPSVNDDACLVYRPGVRWDDVPGTDRHLAVRLADHVPVLWVDPPLSVARAGAGRRASPARQLDEVAANVWRLVTLAPPYPDRTVLAPVSAALVHRATVAALATLGRRAMALIVSAPRPQPRLAPATPYVYYATDDFVAGAALLHSSPAVMRRAEARQLHIADALVAVSPLLLARWGRDSRPRLLLPNGCDVPAYAAVDDAPLPAEVHLPAPVAGVVGQLSARLDLRLLEAVAAAGISLLLVGPVGAGLATERFRALLARPNVQWVGPKPFAELPGYLRVIDVGLTPYADTAFNRASFPLKTLEYLAAGRAVVSTPLPAVDYLDTPLVSTAATPDDFVATTKALLARPRSRADVLARQTFAAHHSWAARARAMLDLVTGLQSAPVRRVGR